MTGENLMSAGFVLAAILAAFMICLGSCKQSYEKEAANVQDTLNVYKHNYEVLKQAYEQKQLECVWKDKENANMKHIVDMQTRKLKGIFERHPDEATYKPGQDPELGDTLIIFYSPSTDHETPVVEHEQHRRPYKFDPKKTIEE